tara:strand:- start:11733 stop:11960 length:228 start_codon:yes stop_codon:yes gene_type:complete
MDKDLELIKNQTGCDLKKAEKFFKKHNYNMTDTILDILGVYNETKIKKQTYDDKHRQKILELRDIEDNRKQTEKE